MILLLMLYQDGPVYYEVRVPNYLNILTALNVMSGFGVSGLN